MRTEASGPESPGGPLGALTEPTRSVSKLWVGWLSLISIGVWAGFFGPIQVLLAQQAEAVSPDHKEAVLALVTGAGAAVSVVFNPVWGALSDRTVLRVGGSAAASRS